MTVQEEIRQAIGTDAVLVKLRRKIESGKADFNDTFRYSDRAAKLLGEIFARRLPDIPADEREAICVAILHDRYTDINALCDRVQRMMDEAAGLHLNPQHAPFPEERAHTIGASTADQTKPLETQQRRAESAAATAARAMHDDRMQAESKFRSRLGLTVVIERTGANCCPWCAEVAGKYRYGDEPEGVFRRHDNCNCTIIYDTQVLRGAVGEDGRRTKTWEEVNPEKVRGFEPDVNTPEQAKELEETALQGLTLPGQRDIMNLNDSIELLSGADKIDAEQQKTLDRALAPIPEKLLTQLSEYVSEITIDNDRGYSSYNRENHSIILDRKKAAKDIIHELGHAFGDMLNLYEDPEFLRIIANGLDLQDWKGIEPKKHPARGTPVYFYTGVGAKKFLSPYQGRIYVRQDDVGKGNIDPALFREYISVGFDYYFKNPNGLKRSDPDLYHYLEVLINGFTSSSNEGQN